MLKIFVTGDNHIGKKYDKHEEAAKLVQCRMDAFDSMVEKANQEECGLFVITGDLFDKTYGITAQVIKDLMKKLAEFHGTVVVLPGNHDFYDADDPKIWKQVEKEQADNVLLLKEYKPYSVPVGDETAVLYPAFCKTLHSNANENNLGWIKNTAIEQDGAYHIGIAHGAVEGETIDNEGKYFCMTRKELESIPVDVWLLGHTHVPFPKNLTEEFKPCEKILNPGTHVQTDVNCNTEGLCFIVEIGDDKKVCTKKFVSGNMRFYRETVTISAGEMEEDLDRVLAKMDDNSVVELTLQGAATEDEYARRVVMMEEKCARFVEYKFDDSALSRLITPDMVTKEFPETSFSARLLTALMDEPKEAQLAYELLQALKEGK